MENGELDLWNPKSIIDGDNQKSLLMRHNVHSGPVRGLDFSPVQGNLLASGATDGEVGIFESGYGAMFWRPLLARFSGAWVIFDLEIGDNG